MSRTEEIQRFLPDAEADNVLKTGDADGIYEGIAFRFPFRDYQRKVIDSLPIALKDRRLHISAAPGAGKTVIGLELIRRLGNPALILAPTIQLRDQWSDRFLELFVREEDRSLWKKRISADPDHPGVLTCMTYQAFYQRCVMDGNAGVFPGGSGNAGLTLCLDEAHHLKQEWWKALNEFRNRTDPVTISLTATPPYDASNLEWKRYRELCGEIDLEISAPELVQKKCLCPHQDYVWLFDPSPEEADEAAAARQERLDAQEAFLKDRQLYRCIMDHPGLRKPEEVRALFLSQPAYPEALIAWLKQYGAVLRYEYEDGRREAEAVYERLDADIRRLADSGEIPPVNESCFEILAKGILDFDREHFGAFADRAESWLKQKHLLKNGKLRLKEAAETEERIFRNTAARLQAAADIVKHESGCMGSRLRCLVLMDRIRAEDLKRIGTAQPLTEPGCVPLFERLRRMEHLGNLEAYMTGSSAGGENGENRYPAVLGMLTASLAILPEHAMRRAPAAAEPIGVTGYCLARLSDANRSEMISFVTERFRAGEIRVLTGTAALLGEGWDAPFVNTVVLGSTAATYVQSNQMRGRGLRIDPEHPDKTADIWHPVTAGAEYDKLCRRLDSIQGPDYAGTVIESGPERLELKPPGSEYTAKEREAYRKRILALSADREGMRRVWERFDAVSSDSGRIRETASVPAAPDFLFGSRKKELSPKQIRKLSEGLCAAMKKVRRLSGQAFVRMEKQSSGRYGIFLEEASVKESREFSQALSQLFSSVGSPRYLMVIRSFPFQKRYLSVPELFGGSRKTADVFFNAVEMSGKRLYYTGNEEGREALFQARIRELKVGRRTVRIVRMLWAAR